ncbi:MAG: hypothetical protein HPM95_17170 [Alphaproteobacteria bacterium]|nr:hypothetical protein [Alphaproteobacteria bacterium]
MKASGLSLCGTMGLVQRDSIHRLLRHAKGYSLQFDDLHQYGLDRLYRRHGQARQSDPREMAVSDQVVIWGTSGFIPVNVMTRSDARKTPRRQDHRGR